MDLEGHLGGCCLVNARSLAFSFVIHCLRYYALIAVDEGELLIGLSVPALLY